MRHTFHPGVKKYLHLVKGYTEMKDGAVVFESSSFESYPGAGAFVSTAEDLSIWNSKLHGGKLLKEATYDKMVTKHNNAIRQHPIFGMTEYGYGLTINNKAGILQIGQTGFAPGFVSMNFYFPESKTSVIMLANVAYDTDDLEKTFYYHTEVLKILINNKLK